MNGFMDVDSVLDACKIIIKGQEMVKEGEKYISDGREEIKRGYEELTKSVGSISTNTANNFAEVSNNDKALQPVIEEAVITKRRILKRRSPRSDDEMVNLITKLLQKHKRGLTVNAVKGRIGSSDKRIRDLRDSLIYKGVIEYEFRRGGAYPVMKLRLPEKQKKSKG